MARLRPETFFENQKRQKALVAITFVMFLSLAAETLLSGFSAVYEQGDTHFVFQLKATKTISIFIYISVALLLLLRVDYKILLIPDIVLFSVKLYSAFHAFQHLYTADYEDPLNLLTEWESLLENGLFCLFLLTLFACKLLPSSESMHLKLPYICFTALILCFPVTVFFESIKISIEAATHIMPFSAALFNFLIGVLSEAFLDLPYALMIFIVFFVPHKIRHKKIQ